MLSSRQLSPFIVLSIGLWMLGALLAGADFTISGNLLRPIGPVLFAVGIVLIVFDRWLWHFRILYPWFVDRPDLRGTWQATFVSSYVPAGERDLVGPVKCQFVIRQTFFFFAHPDVDCRILIKHGRRNGLPRSRRLASHPRHLREPPSWRN